MMNGTGNTVFESVIEVKEEDLDEMNHVNNVRYLQWVQDIAEAHWKSLADEKQQQKFAWVVISHFINYKTPAFLNTKVRIITYVKESSGVTSLRIVEMYDSLSEKLLVRAETKWCLLHRETLKPCRIPKEIVELFHP